MPTYANIGGTRKTVSSWYSNIGGARKEIQTMYTNVENARKIIYESGTDYWSIPYNSSGTLSSSTRYNRMASTSATVNSSGTFTLQNATSTKGRPAAGTFMVKVNNGSSTTTTGTILYYFYNSTGGYYAFDTNVSNTSSTAVSRVKSTTYSSDVVYDSSNKKLLLKGLLVPNYYRWEKWKTNSSYTETSSGSGTVTLYDGGYLTGGDEYYSDSSSGLFYIKERENGGYYGYSTSDIILAYEREHRDLTRQCDYHIISTNTYADTMYAHSKINSVNGDTVVLNYNRKYYFNPSSSTSSLSGYVFSPNSSAYTTGSTYKNKTTL